MTNATTKFKERSPKETVTLIQNFFSNKGYQIRIINEIQSEANTYSCGLELYKNQQLILTSCGKGINYDFSLASGYAELYERFCNKCNFTRHPFFMHDRNIMTYNTYGYYMHPQEKVLNYEDIMQYTMYNTFLNRALHSYQNIQAYFKLNTNNNCIIGEPFYDLTNNTIVHHNQQLVNRVTGSVGMCAGNTIEEALNQGLSEICEHMVLNKFFTEDQSIYYAIDPSVLNPELQQKIINIQNAGFKIYIFDLSYNFNLPVAMSLLINPLTQTTTMNFGSFPIFDIAAERVITELYQGIQSFKHFTDFKFHMQYPFRTASRGSLNARKNTLADTCCFNEDIILYKIKTTTEYNKQIFIDDQNISNHKLVQYFIKLYQQHGYSIHYIDNSLCEDMKAVSIIIPDYDYEYYNVDFQKYLNYSEEIIYNHLINLMKVHKLINTIYNNDNTISDCMQRFLDIQKFQYQDPDYDGSLFGALMFVDWLNPIPTPLGTLTIDLFIEDLPRSFSSPLRDSIFFLPIKTYATIQNYVLSQQYSINEIQNILNTLFNLNLTII